MLALCSPSVLSAVLASLFATGGALLLSSSVFALFFSPHVVGRFLALISLSVCVSSLVVDVASSVRFFCALLPLAWLGLSVIVSLLSLLLAPLGFNVSTLSSPVFALRFNVERVVAYISLFAAERRAGVVFRGAVVVIAIGWECGWWCGCFVIVFG